MTDHQQGRPQVPVRRRVPPRLHRVQRARCALTACYGRRAAPTRNGVIVDDNAARRSRASCGGAPTARRASIRRRARISRTTRSSPARIRRKSTRSWRRSRRTGRRRSAAPRHAGGQVDHELPVDLRQGEGQPAPAAGLPAARGSRQIAEALGASHDWPRRSRRSRSATTPTTGPAAATRSSTRSAGRNSRPRRRGAGDALLSGDAALLSAGSLLHVAQRRHARLYYLAGKLDIAAAPIKDWKLKVGKSAQAPVP